MYTNLYIYIIIKEKQIKKINNNINVCSYGNTIHLVQILSVKSHVFLLMCLFVNSWHYDDDNCLFSTM